MGGSISSLFGVTDDESSEDYLQLTDLGGFLSKYIFIMLDKDKRKLVSKQEYLALVNHFREQETMEEELDNFLKRHVAEGQSTEYINEALFRQLFIQLIHDFDRNVGDRMKYLMTLFDKDNDGFVNETDLCQVYDAIGIQVPREPIRCLIGKYDEDGDGKLSEKEFEKLGRSAMNKLYIRKEGSPVDALVEEALRKGSASIASASQTCSNPKPTKDESKEKEEDFLNNNHIANEDNNTDINNNVNFMVVDNVVFGKPVVLKASSIFADDNTSDTEYQTLGETMTNKVFVSGSGDSATNIMKEALSELQVGEENVA